MKAGIVTFQSAYNYGAVLQAFALQEYLNRNFAETKILDYHNKKMDASYQNPQLTDFFRNPKNAVFKTFQSVLYRGKKIKIDQFRKQHLLLTQRYDKDNVTEAKDEADVFITGSDQVWNYLIVNKDSAYYLDFATEKTTCSYAASFGISEIPKEYRTFYKQNLRKIDFISVREKNGVGLVESLIGQRAEVMPDPTLLINQKTWEMLSIAPAQKEKYILVYKITKADRLLKFAKTLSKKTGLSIVYIPNDLKSGSIGHLKTNVGPEEWLGYIKHAEYIVTNSFHGTVFAVLFNKKFFSEVSDKVNPSTSRLQSLLVMFGLEHRTIDQYTDIVLDEELDAEKIKDVLATQRSYAHEYFRKVFKSGENK